MSCDALNRGRTTAKTGNVRKLVLKLRIASILDYCLHWLHLSCRVPEAGGRSPIFPSSVSGYRQPGLCLRENANHPTPATDRTDRTAKGAQSGARYRVGELI